MRGTLYTYASPWNTAWCALLNGDKEVLCCTAVPCKSHEQARVEFEKYLDYIAAENDEPRLSIDTQFRVGYWRQREQTDGSIEMRHIKEEDVRDFPSPFTRKPPSIKRAVELLDLGKKMEKARREGRPQTGDLFSSA